MKTQPRRSTPLRLTVDGTLIRAQEGETVAAAMIAAGLLKFCRVEQDAPRGPFCGMGICHDCLVMIDGRPSQRACLATVQDGMTVIRQPSAATPLGTIRDAPMRVALRSACDVLIVGAGPAGLAAALACPPGAAVRVVDERPAPGGQYYKQPLHGSGDRQSRAGASLIARVRGSNVQITSGTTVWGAFRDDHGALAVGLRSGSGSELISPRILVIATGAYERAWPVPGWTLPGVMTVGACQSLVRAQGVVPGRRIVVAGNGPLGLQCATELLRAGAQVVAVAEAAPPLWRRPGALSACVRSAPALLARGAGYVATLRRHGVALLHRHVLVRVDGTTEAESAHLAPIGADGVPLRGQTRRIEADVICLGYGFLASNELARLLGCEHRLRGRGLETVRDDAGQTSQPDVFVIGEAGGIGGAHCAEAQGQLAGLRIGDALGAKHKPVTHAAMATLRRHRRFQAGLRTLFAAPALDAASLADASTVICRCESITYGELRRAVAQHGIGDAGMLKRATRIGMGRCQGRYCGEHVDALLHAATPPTERRLMAPQMPVKPVPTAALAGEQPEWRGHRRTSLPRRPPPPTRPLPVSEADTVIIGGGIAGLSTALYLARSGHDVVILDQGEPGAEASGGNAGTLHVQLLSFDFAGGGTTPAARTLPLQRDAAQLWQTIQHASGTSMEIVRSGGLMLAETEAELATLREKVALENGCGIDVELIGPSRLYELEPALRPGLAGAALCPQEGKINPLLATFSTLEAARAAGAKIVPQTSVQAIERSAAGFRVMTQCGAIRAGRVVNAAGAWAGQVAAMLGAHIPIFGAPLQMIVTEPVEPALRHLVAHVGHHLTLKQAAAGGFIVGGGWTAGLDPVHARPRPLVSSLAGNLWVACHVLPALECVHVVRSWAAMNVDIDGAPILGEDPAIPGLYHAVGANGFTLGPLLGEITARLILHGDAGRDIAPFSAARFRL